MFNSTSMFEWPVTIYYEDTDAGGVVYHANYLKFFERARTEMLRSNGVNQQSLWEQNIGFVVRHLDIEFIRGAVLDEQLTVRTYISEKKKVFLVFAQELVDSTGSVLCRATVKIVCVAKGTNNKMKPITIPRNCFPETI